MIASFDDAPYSFMKSWKLGSHPFRGNVTINLFDAVSNFSVRLQHAISLFNVAAYSATMIALCHTRKKSQLAVSIPCCLGLVLKTGFQDCEEV